MGIKKQLFFTILLLIGTILFFAYSDVDFLVQDFFFNFNLQTWVLDRDLEPEKFIFYDGVKKVLILFAVSLLIALVFFKEKNVTKNYRDRMILVLLSLILVPLIVGGFKKYTNMPCPKNEIHYGGVYPETKVWESYPKEFKKSEIKCWPAGHASGGFALMSLFFFFKKRKNKIVALISALSVGWSMGLYKMLIGDHFLSHTLITMIMAWLVILTIIILIDRFTKDNFLNNIDNVQNNR